MKNVIETKNLSKKYKGGFEIKDLTINIKSGIITGFVGENGAGKTTFIKLILNVLKNYTGEVNIFGKNTSEFDSQIKEDIGIVLDEKFFPEDLNAQNINTIMSGIYKRWDSNTFFKYLEKFKIPKKAKIKSLSKGMKKKLELSTALSHHPKLLILDEPTSGLDPVVRNEVLDIFLEFIQDEEHSIFLSTHITSDLDNIADEVVFIENGDIVLQENRDEIIDNYGILKCDIADLNKINPSYILKVKKNKYGCEVLINSKNEVKEQYPNFIVDNVNIENLMVLFIKGENLC